MLPKILTMMATILTVFFLAWAVVNAGVGMNAADIASETWLNSDPIHLSDLKGKVVMVEFWTFGCYNCRNVEPYVKEWHQKYAERGLVVIGVHSPEFSYERNLDQVTRYLKEHDLPHNPLYDLGYSSIGCAPCTRLRFAGEPERAGRWAGIAKWECGIHVNESAQQGEGVASGS